MTTQFLTPLAGSSRHRLDFRPRIALILASISLVLVAAGAWLPWLTVFNGLNPIPGFQLDGGYLAGVALASAGLLAVAARYGGSVFLRTLAMVGATFVFVDALFSASRISAYVADPGPTAVLVSPTAGNGPLVMAAGGLVLILAAVLTPARRSRLEIGMRMRLVLASVLFVAGWIHLILTPEHLAESMLLGLGFLIFGLIQLLLAAAVILRPESGVLSLVLTVNVALIAIYAYAVIVGLPGDGGHGSEHAAGLVIGSGEPISINGATGLLCELAALTLAVMLMRHIGRTSAISPEPARARA